MNDEELGPKNGQPSLQNVSQSYLVELVHGIRSDLGTVLRCQHELLTIFSQVLQQHQKLIDNLPPAAAQDEEDIELTLDGKRVR